MSSRCGPNDIIGKEKENAKTTNDSTKIRTYQATKVDIKGAEESVGIWGSGNPTTRPRMMEVRE